MNEQRWHLKTRNNFQVSTENTFNFNLDITFESHKEIIWLKKDVTWWPATENKLTVIIHNNNLGVESLQSKER